MVKNYVKNKKNDSPKDLYTPKATRLHSGNLIKVTQEIYFPIVMACIRKDTTTLKYIQMLQSVAQRFEGVLRVYYSFDELFEHLSKQYDFHGTPTFLLLKKGVVLNSLLGNITYESLYRIIVDTFFVSENNTPRDGGCA